MVGASRCGSSERAGPLGLLVDDPLLHQVIGHRYAAGRTAYGHLPVGGARRVHALLGYVNGDAAHLLDFDQWPAAGADDGAHDRFGHVHLPLDHGLLVVGGHLVEGGSGGRCRCGRRVGRRPDSFGRGRGRGRGSRGGRHTQPVRVGVGQRRAGRVLRQDRVDGYRAAGQAQVEQVVGHRTQEPGAVVVRHRRRRLQDAGLVDQSDYAVRAEYVVPVGDIEKKIALEYTVVRGGSNKGRVGYLLNTKTNRENA